MLFSRRTRPSLTVEIDTDRPEYRPGDVVRATVRLTPTADLATPEISVALVHADSVTDGRTHTDSWAVDGRFLVEETPMAGGRTETHVVDLRVPERTVPGLPETGEPLVADPADFRHDLEASDLWGAPSSAGERVSSRWYVEVVARGAGRTPDRHRPVVVRAPAGEGPSTTTSRGPAAVVVDLPARSVAPGETLTGRLRVTPETELSARGLRVDLLLVERAEERVLRTDRRVEVAVSGPTTLPARLPRELPFTLTVPADATPTAHAAAASLTWELHGVVDLARRGDAVGVREVRVHSSGCPA